MIWDHLREGISSDVTWVVGTDQDHAQTFLCRFARRKAQCDIKPLCPEILEACRTKTKLEQRDVCGGLFSTEFSE